MSFLGLHEQMLFITRRKNQINSQLESKQMDLLSATKQSMKEQSAYTENLKEIYTEYYEQDRDAYTELYEEITVDYQDELDKITSWQSEIEVEKENLETQLSELSSYEQSWQKLESTNIKSDFTYGSVGGGSKTSA